MSQTISTLATASPRSSITSSFQDESHFHGDPELVDLAVPHACFLLDHMKASYTAQVLFARESPSWTAASKLVGEAAVIFDTLATAITSSLNIWQQ